MKEDENYFPTIYVTLYEDYLTLNDKINAIRNTNTISNKIIVP